MSEENLEILRAAVEAWNSGGTDDMLAFYAEDVIWYPFPDAPGGSDGLHGHSAVRELMAGWTDSFEGFAVVTDELRDLGDRVLWLGEMSGTDQGLKRASQPTHGRPRLGFSRRQDRQGEDSSPRGRKPWKPPAHPRRSG